MYAKLRETTTSKINGVVNTLEQFTFKMHAEHAKKTILLHQIYPSYFLAVEQPDQKGLLINHYMGTGKTTTGIQFMYTFYQKKKIIVLPSYIKAVWEKEIQGYGFGREMEEHGLGEYTFLFYEEVLDFFQKNKDIRDTILIMDEGHHIVELLKQTYTSAEVITVLSGLKKMDKIMLMTGTPFSMDEFDITYLINIVAGTTLLPYSKTEFRKQFFYTNKLSAFFSGYFSPVFTSKLPLYTGFAFFAVYMWDFVKYSTTMTSKLIPIERDVDYKLNQNENSRYTSFGEKKEGEALAVTGESSTLPKSYFDGAKYSTVAPSFETMTTVTAYLALFNMSVAITPAATVMVMPLLPVFLAILLSVYCYINRLSELENIKLLNLAKLSKVISKYISYYEVPSDTSGYINHLITYTSNGFRNQHNSCYSLTQSKILPSNKTLCCPFYKKRIANGSFMFPEIKITQSFITYTPEQCMLFLRMSYNMLSHDDAYDLKLTSLPKLDKSIDPDLYELDKSLSTHVKDLSVFKDKGRIIGNIGPMPPKFVKLYEIIGEEPAVVYSNFYEEGILLFEQFLSQKTKTYAIIEPSMSQKSIDHILQRFKTTERSKDRIQIILVHPLFTEGISLFECRQLHILEPMLNYAHYEQLVARVVRYKSHSMLPPEKRQVKVYVWITTVTDIITRILYNKLGTEHNETSTLHKGTNLTLNHFSRKVKSYIQHSPETIYWSRLNQYNQDITPDTLVFNDLLKLKKTTKAFQEKIKELSIESCHNQALCKLMKVSLKQIQKTRKKKNTYTEEPYDTQIPHIKCNS
jgi:superfamily II DNA or RNA helicase